MPERDCRRILAAEDVLGVAQLRAREPLRTRHLAPTQHGRRLGTPPHPGGRVRGRPERIEVVDRPGVQVGVGVEAAADHEAARSTVCRHQPRVLSSPSKQRASWKVVSRFQRPA